LSYVDTRGEPPAEPAPLALSATAYNPWPTLAPRNYSVRITPGNFGEASIVTASGGDIAGLHALTASLTTEWERPELQGSIAYDYGRLPFDVTASVYRVITPESNYQLGSTTVDWVQQSVGVSTGISYSFPRAFDAQSFNLTYSVTNMSGRLPFPIANVNPYDTPVLPTNRGMLASLHLGWAYSNAQSYLWSVGNERGFDLSTSFDFSDAALGSDFTGYAASASFATYIPMPWLSHHVLSLAASGGASGGSAAGGGPFYIGGFVDTPLVSVVQNLLVQGGIHLRGYPVVAEQGNYFALFNGEYRFPIVNVDHGPSTLPVFLNRISGAAFVDYGSAFNDPQTALFKTGVGGELWFDMMLGYTLGFTFRAGYAKGLASTGIEKTYFVAAVPF
jgi:hypothetical protein